MSRRLTIALCLTAMLVLLLGCSENEPWKQNPVTGPDIQYTLTISPDLRLTAGIGFYNPSFGNAFSFDDRYAFYIRDQLWRKDLVMGWINPLLPSSLTCSDQNYLAANPVTQTLYFAANGDIYRINFDGSQLHNLTLEDTPMLRSPALSFDKRYLTMIRDGKINRLDLQTGDRVEIDNEHFAEYAIYRPDLNRYYYFSASFNPMKTSLYRCDADGSHTVSILDESVYNHSFGVSLDGRLFAMLVPMPDSDARRLRVYHSNEDHILDIDQCHSFSFSPASAQLYYSQTVYGAANLYHRDMNTAETRLLFDGILDGTRYFRTIDKLTTRGDGSALYFMGFVKGYRPSI